MIFSKEYTFKYKDGLLQERNWSYSGIDSKGTDHFEKKTVGFKPYSFVYEDYYVYDSDNNLIRIDQNTPHSKETDIHAHKRIRMDNIKINDIPARDYFLSYFTDIYRIIIELNKNQYLDFETY